MMEVLFFIAIGWLIVTMVGHLTWVVFATIFRLAFAPKTLYPPPPSRVETPETQRFPTQSQQDSPASDDQPSASTDLAAFSRMMDALTANDQVDAETASQLKASARDLARTSTPASVDPVVDVVPPTTTVAKSPPTVDSVVPVKANPTATSRTELGPTPPLPIAEEAVAAEVVAAEAIYDPPAPTTPKRALSEVITSFLARNNIRWGELVAGLLVVVCSIGLVVSLWNTLTSAHRVVPSLIFMSADAAIFAAGLYTVRRWKLRHTSRAVLIIATLLVPLCVLAGMAAAGAGLDSVTLSDPATLGTIVAGLAGCGWLLLQSSRSLVGRADALPMTASVITPTLALPLLPTAARLLGPNAGLAVLAPAICVAAALLWPQRTRQKHLQSHERTNLVGGRRHWKNRWLSLGIASSAMVSVLVYAAFLLSDLENEFAVQAAWIQIAIASIPFWIAIASSCHNDSTILRQTNSLSSERGWMANSNLIATVLTLLSMGVVLAILPASLRRLDWMWMHAVVAAASWLAASIALRQPSRIIGATLPLGIAAMLSSPVWMGDINWGDLPLWRLVLGGEPMVTSLGIAALLGGIGFTLNQIAKEKSWVREFVASSWFAACTWGALAFVQALVLSVAPVTWLGQVRPVLIDVVLGLSALGCILGSFKDSRASLATPVILIAFWTSVLGLLTWPDGRLHADLTLTPWIGLAVTMSLMVAAGLAKFLLQRLSTSGERPGLLERPGFLERSSSLSRTADQSMRRHASSAGVMACLSAAALGGIALFSLSSGGFEAPGWWSASGQLWLLVGSLSGVAILLRERGWLQTSMGLSAITVATTLTAFLGVTVWHSESWLGGIATWWVAAIFASTSALWMLVRTTAPLRTWFPSNKHQTVHLNWPQMPDGLFAMLATGTIVFTVTRQYAAIVAGPLEEIAQWSTNDWIATANFAWFESAACLGLVAGTSALFFLSRSHTEDSLWSENGWQDWFLGLLGAASLYLASQLGLAWTDTAATCLVITTTLACAFLFAWKFRLRITTQPWLAFLSPSSSERLAIHSMIAGLVAAASLVLLGTGWLAPLSNNQSPDRFSTLAVATWWVIASIGLLWSKSDSARETKSNSLLSSVLLPAAVCIATPAIATRVPFVNQPLVWVQMSVFGSLAWLLLEQLVSKASGSIANASSRFITGAHLSRVWILVVGLVCCIVSGSIAYSSTGTMLQSPFSLWTLPIGGLVSLIAVMVAMRCYVTPARDSWPFAISLLSGHATVLVVWMQWIHPDSALTLLCSIWLVASIGSAVLHWIRNIPLHAWHMTLLTFAMAWVGLFDNDTAPWALSSLVVVGLAVAGISCTRFGRTIASDEESETDTTPPRRSSWQTIGSVNSLAGWNWRFVLPRLLGWTTVGVGGFLLWNTALDPIVAVAKFDPTSIWLAWMALWVTVWRSVRNDRSAPLADIETACAMIPIAALGWIESHLALPRSAFAGSGWIGVTSGTLTLASLGLVTASAWLRPRGRTVWFVSLVLSCIAVSEVALWIGSQAGLTTNLGFAVTHLAVSATLVAWTYGSSLIGQARLQLAGSLERVTLIWVGLSSLLACWLLVDHISEPWPRICILTTGALAWVFFELSERNLASDPATTARRRHITVGIVLWSVALMAVLTGLPLKHPALIAVMRLLIAGVLMVAVLLLAIPKLFNGPFMDRWSEATTRGGLISGIVSIGSLIIMLALETAVRKSVIGIPGISMPVVIAVAITLGGLAAMAGVLAVLTGPNSRLPNAIQNVRLTDSQRKWLLYVAQGVAATTWLHLFLCRTGIAFLGLRQVWPYVVMVIAFASVGLTQWAIRRGDQVLADVMRRTSMFLPMIPVVGFWLSGSYAVMTQSEAWSWTFFRGTTSYQGLLLVGAIYYGMMSLLWKNGVPRVATVVLANAALWVTLTQVPGWDFITHPQAWLIPPAVCVLLVAHLQRDRLEAAMGSAIRYACTLVIYLSSTADMLLSEVGRSLWGPVILVLLALAGMALGVILRVKPFLYLGTIFVFLGVTSMVWHSTQAIDAVWPWWAFGITTGLLLLTGLAMIEKHRPRLNQWASQLASWES
ncbi:hypothetical protein RBSH_00109 [Rhodopirellula baltica SH28]|uniref:Uncharacterized protein n=1 Tax=Rhodopirellula baltica SH28 TaxID=993517 RepID=K5DNN5_RHOBT|nr:hypothetical protein [Rhodopirellula baltica]EKK04494.1 hypothetical protein RBSH_00109 [Rhodopirellula baltica SH28]